MHRKRDDSDNDSGITFGMVLGLVAMGLYLWGVVDSIKKRIASLLAPKDYVKKIINHDRLTGNPTLGYVSGKVASTEAVLVEDEAESANILADCMKQLNEVRKGGVIDMLPNDDGSVTVVYLDGSAKKVFARSVKGKPDSVDE